MNHATSKIHNYNKKWEELKQDNTLFDPSFIKIDMHFCFKKMTQLHFQMHGTHIVFQFTQNPPNGPCENSQNFYPCSLGTFCLS